MLDNIRQCSSTTLIKAWLRVRLRNVGYNRCLKDPDDTGDFNYFGLIYIINQGVPVTSLYSIFRKMFTG